MNRLDSSKRSQVVRCLCEGNSIRATSRLCDCAVNTVVKLLLELGPACAQYQAENLRQLDSMIVQVDEIWSFVGCKQKRVRTCTIEPWTQPPYEYRWVLVDTELFFGDHLLNDWQPAGPHYVEPRYIRR